MTSYALLNNPVLRGPLEPKLGSPVTVHDQSWFGITLGDGSFERIGG
jgi:hypothetical protein